MFVLVRSPTEHGFPLLSCWDVLRSESLERDEFRQFKYGWKDSISEYVTQSVMAVVCCLGIFTHFPVMFFIFPPMEAVL